MGAEEMRARDLFYALWVPDLFMKRVETSGQWTLFCPNEAPGLSDVHSAEFEELYERYEKEVLMFLAEDGSVEIRGTIS